MKKFWNYAIMQNETKQNKTTPQQKHNSTSFQNKTKQRKSLTPGFFQDHVK